MAGAMAEPICAPCFLLSSIPNLLLYGEADMCSPITIAEELHRAILDSISSSSQASVINSTWRPPTDSIRNFVPSSADTNPPSRPSDQSAQGS